MDRWTQWSARIDELALRERALLFVAIAAFLVLLVHIVAVQPLLREQRGYLDRIRQDQAQLKSIGEVLLKSARAAADHPGGAKRERIRALEAKLAAAERILAERRKGQLAPEQLTRMLQDIVGRSRNLQVLALRVLPGTAVSAGPATPSPAPGKSAPAVLYRHAVEVEMTGSYLELLRYLEEVQALPWRLAWAAIELKTTKHPEVQLKATLSAVSTSPTLIKF